MPPKRSRYQENAEMPASLATKLAKSAASGEQGTDDKRFKKKFKNTAKTRKLARKQARQDKKQRKNEAHHRARGYATTPSQAKNKPKQTTTASAKDSKNSNSKTKDTKPMAKPLQNNPEDERAKLTRFAKRNEGLYQLLRESNLIDNVDAEAGIKSRTDEAEELEDREMRRLERNLGIKNNNKLANAFHEEGLGDLFQGFEFGSRNVRSKDADQKPVAGDQAKTVTGSKRRELDDSEEDEDEQDGDLKMDVDSDSASDLDDDEDGHVGGSEGMQDEDDMFGLNDFGSDEESDAEDSDIAEMYRTQGVDVNPDLSEASGSEDDDDKDEDEESGNESDDMVSDEHLSSSGSDSESDSESEGTVDKAASKHASTEQGQSSMASSTPNVGKYIPPSLRRKQADADDERLGAIRKALQGQLNRLSESNIEGIILQIEAQYQKYPRHDVTQVLGGLILHAIQSRIHMLDTFLYVNAALVGAVYRAIGLEPVASIVQRLMEEFEKSFEQGNAEFKLAKGKAASGKEEEEEEDGEPVRGKECQNLCAFIAELYNFQVISCQLVYDMIRMCVGDINEFTAEVLLKLIRISGMQLRRDDPLALKEIVQQVTNTVTKAGIGSFSVRCQFMVENLTHLKDNRMRNTMAQSADNVARLKKFLGNMDKRRSVASAEPINIGIQDIRDIETKGKWWLVGASWVGNQYQGEQQNDKLAAREALRKVQNEAGDSEADRLMHLARQQHMNTDVRRSIFVTLLSSEDYADAFERLLRLDLKKTQVREVVRVVLHCCGQETAYNPYYTLVAFKLCCYHNTYRLTLQYALWDFLREMGESDVGGLSRVDQEEDHGSAANVPLRRIVNMAKLFAWLVDKQVLSLLILKTVTFASVGKQARIFFQVMFSTIFLQHKRQTDKDVESLHETFQKATANPTMCHGILFFFQHFVKNCELVKDEEKPVVKWGCKIAKQAFRTAAGPEMHNDVF
ncbi:suppressor of glycerol defect [Coemansia sp. IMI 203386]|nr:suppressor of glycerol defect [Coemansia sp. IMI 203386]